MVKIKIVDKILNLIEKNPSTTEEISDKLEVPIKNMRSYLSNLKKDGRIEYDMIKKGDEFIRIWRSLSLKVILKQLYEIMIDFMKPAKQLPKEKLELVKKIEAMIENE